MFALTLGLSSVRGGGAAAAPFVPPALTTAKVDGDSRSQNMGGRSVTGPGGGFTATGGYGNGYSATGLIQPICGNKWIHDEGYLHAVGATSTKTMQYRSQTTDIDSTLPGDLTANPGYVFSGSVQPAEAEWSILSDSLFTVVTQPGHHVFLLCSVNDTATNYNTPFTNSVSLTIIGQYLDALGAAGKMVYLANELPRGDSYYQMEAHGAAASITVTNNAFPANFQDGDSFGDIGVVGWAGAGTLPVPFTKVGSAPGQNQYTVAAGVYAQGGTARQVWINYNATPTGGRTNNTATGRVMNDWFNSSAANFVSSLGDNYGVPGCQYQRPYVHVFDSWGALLDPAHAGGSNIPLPATFDILQLHPSMPAAARYAAALKTAFDADYPSAPSLELRPIYNNWYIARHNGLLGNQTGTLPPSMRIAKAGLLSGSGVPFASVDASGNVTPIAGNPAFVDSNPANSFFNFSTGAWKVHYTASGFFSNGTQIWFEQDIGNYDLVNMVEGTIGRNCLMNGMMDGFTAVGFNLPAVNGTSTVTGITAAMIPYGWGITGAGLNTAIAAGNAAITVGQETWGDGYPRFFIEIEGVHTATMNIQFQSATVNAPLARLQQARFQSGLRQMYAKHSTNGHLYGTFSNTLTGNINQVPSINRLASGRPSANTTVSGLATRTVDGGAAMYVSDAFLAVPFFGGNSSDLYRLAPLSDLTGNNGSTTTLTQLLLNTNNVPIAIRYGMGQAQLRSRSDI